MISNFKKAATAIREHFIYMDELLEVLQMALETKCNIILYGPGGYGKSDVALLAGRILSEEEPFLLPFGPSMRKSSLFGDLRSIKVIDDEGELTKFRHDFYSSFGARKVAIFEELFDGPAPLIAALKHALQFLALCEGDVCYDILTQLVIAATNINPLDWVARAEDDERASRQALLGRFLFQYKVEWPSHEMSDYKELLDKVRKYKPEVTKDSAFAYLCGLCHDNGVTISPRTAVKISTAFDTYKERVFLYLPEMTPELSRMMKVKIIDGKKVADTFDLAKELIGMLQSIKKIDASNYALAKDSVVTVMKRKHDLYPHTDTAHIMREVEREVSRVQKLILPT